MTTAQEKTVSTRKRPAKAKPSTNLTTAPDEKPKTSAKVTQVKKGANAAKAPTVAKEASSAPVKAPRKARAAKPVENAPAPAETLPPIKAEHIVRHKKSAEEHRAESKREHAAFMSVYDQLTPKVMIQGVRIPSIKDLPDFTQADGSKIVDDFIQQLKGASYEVVYQMPDQEINGENWHSIVARMGWDKCYFGARAENNIITTAVKEQLTEKYEQAILAHWRTNGDELVNIARQQMYADFLEQVGSLLNLVRVMRDELTKRRKAFNEHKAPPALISDAKTEHTNRRDALREHRKMEAA